MSDNKKKVGKLAKDLKRKMEEPENTNKKKSQQNLEEANRFLRHILESSSKISIIVTDRDRVIEYWNSGAENMFGYSSPEVLGRHVNGKVKVYQLWENKSVPPRWETTCAYEGGAVISLPPC